MVTWALFEVRESGKRFYFFNTHFQHTAQGNEARVNSAKLVAERIGKLPQDVPLILTGDFNAAAPDAEPYKILTADLKDAWTTAARTLGPAATSSGFEGRTTGRRIDWILYRGPLTVLEAETVTYNEDARYPSDHFPVVVTFEH
jgi:endonuclease/exonuclease/phosphatase family metal-dependent hydrolase